MMKDSLGIRMVAAAALTCLAAAPGYSATMTWDDGGSDEYWSTGDNWSGTPDNTSPVDGDSVVLTAVDQSRLDYSWTIESGQSLSTTAPAFADELDLVGSSAILRLATGGTMDIGFMRPRFISGGQFIIEPGASLDTDNYGLTTVPATITFIADASGVTTWNNPGEFQLGGDNLVVDLSNYDLANGTTLILVDYGATDPLGTFASTNLTAGWSGSIDYAYDQGGGDLAIALTITASPPPIPTLSEWGMIILVGLVVLVMGRRMLRQPVKPAPAVS